MKTTKINSRSPKAGKVSKKEIAPTSTNFLEHMESVDFVSDGLAPISKNVSISNINAVLSIQEVHGDASSKTTKRMVKWGEDVLDNLDDIRHSLLIGALPKNQLLDLANLLRQSKNKMGDPGLIDIINEIELRAEVELAKLTRKL